MVSEKVCIFLQSNGIESCYLPAYVSPLLTTDHIETKSNYRVRVLSNIGVLKAKDDIGRYGFDFVYRLAEVYRDIGFDVFVGLDRTDALSVYCEKLPNLRFCYGLDMSSYIGNYDCFLRPNRDDAYGNSIQEALDFGVPVLASDVCRRPAGSQIFQTGDYNDFQEKFQTLLSSGFHLDKNIVETSQHHLRLVELYCEILYG